MGPGWCSTAASQSWSYTTSRPGGGAGFANSEIISPCNTHNLPGQQPQCFLVGVGARWIEFDEQCDACGRTLDRYVLQSLANAATTFRDPAVPGGRTIADLDAGSGMRKLCHPLRFPDSWIGGYHEAGALEFQGSFAVARGQQRDGKLATVLERCGSTLHRALPLYYGAVSAGTDAVIWSPAANLLNGVLLSSLKNLSIALPASMVGAQQGVSTALSRLKLYVLVRGQNLAQVNRARFGRQQSLPQTRRAECPKTLGSSTCRRSPDMDAAYPLASRVRGLSSVTVRPCSREP